VNTEVGSPDSGEKARVPVRVAVKTHREERERERERESVVKGCVGV
jgi:hypothetical protein